MKQLYFLNEEEKNRILNLHESATKRQYLSEQTTSPIIVTNHDNAYDYKLENGQYTFRGKPGTTYAQKYPNWVASKTPKGTASIKSVIDTKGKQTTTDPSKVVTTTTDPSKAATVTAGTSQGTPTVTPTNTTQPIVKPTTDTTQAQGTPATPPSGGNGVVSLPSNQIFQTQP